MAKTTGREGLISRSLNKRNIIVILALLALALSYVSAVADPNAPLNWDAGCCGRSFWWSPVGTALVLVAAALIFRVRSQWSLISVGMSVYVSYDFVCDAAVSWNYYYSLDKMQAIREAFLLPVFRPLSGFLALFILLEALRNLLRASNHTRSHLHNLT